MQTVTQRAIAAIGNSAGGDWRLNVEGHLSDLGPEAEALKRILREADFIKAAIAFRDADAAAAPPQKFYKGLARLSAWTGFGAALLGSLVLMFALLAPPGRALMAATIVQGTLLLLSLGTSLIIGIRKPFEAWMLKRAEAENARLALFDYVLRETHQLPSDPLPSLPLQLEYFRRYLLDEQRIYYRQRGEQHAAAARAAWWWRLVAFVLIALAAFPLVWTVKGAAWAPDFLSGIMAYMPERTEFAQRVFLGLGIIAASLQGLLASLAVMSLDERNAARYRATADNLEALAGRPLAEARDAAAGMGSSAQVDRDKVLDFVALVRDQISSEHREWIALRKVAPDLALDHLKSLRLPPGA